MNHATPAGLPSDAQLSVQYRVRRTSRTSTFEYWTINARVANGSRTITCGDFGRFLSKGNAHAALAEARLDLRTRAITAFASFAELVAAPYIPTLADRVLADAYDAAFRDRKASRR